MISEFFMSRAHREIQDIRHYDMNTGNLEPVGCRGVVGNLNYSNVVFEIFYYNLFASIFIRIYYHYLEKSFNLHRSFL